MTTFVTHLESAINGTRLDASVPQNMHAGKPLWVRYDLGAVARAARRDDLINRAPTMWRYRELLPPRDDDAIVSLGETMTPLIPCAHLGSRLGLDDLWVKDESRLPTGSFKSRGLAMAVTMCRQFGIRRVAIPTAGNAGGALAAYAARAGMEAFVFMPSDTPLANQVEAHAAGARVFLVDGLINDCGRIVRDGVDRAGWFDLSTLKEPYRIEGKKTMGLELAEQLGWELPDVIIYPTGGGTGLIGMWKAFDELAALGWLASDQRPRMVVVQSNGCAPIVRAFETGERFAAEFPDAHTIASGLRVPVAIGDFMILDAVHASGGTAVAIDDADIIPAMNEASACEGISFCPESAACVAAARHLVAQGWIGRAERTVIFNCAAGQKYSHLTMPSLPRAVHAAAFDWGLVR